MEKRMNKKEVLELLESLKIDKNEFYILSSCALVIRDLFDSAGDLDIGVTEKGLEELKKNYDLKQKENGWYIVNRKIISIKGEPNEVGSSSTTQSLYAELEKEVCYFEEVTL